MKPLWYNHALLFYKTAGLVWSLYAVVIVDSVDEDRKEEAIGQAFACLGMASVGAGPLAGLSHSHHKLRINFWIIVVVVIVIVIIII